MHRRSITQAPSLTSCSVAVAAALATFATSSTYAAETTLPEVQVSARQETSGLDAPIAAGSRLGLSARDTPASVEQVSAETITQRGDYSVRDAVTRTTGLTDISTQGDGGVAYSARGFTGNNSVGVTEDGQRMMVGAGTITAPSSSWGYERIEVLRGPGSIVNGSGTVGATVNAVRKAARAESSLEAMFGVGDYGTFRAGIGGSGVLGTAGAFRIDAYSETSDGFVDRGDNRSSKLMSTFRFDLRPDLRFDFQFDHADQKPSRYWGTPLVNGTIDGDLRHRNYNVGDAAIEYIDDRLLGRLSWQIAPGLTLRDEVTHFESRRHWRDAEYYAYNAGSGQIDRSEFGYTEIRHKQRQTGNRLEAAYETAGNRLVAGWEASVISFQHTNNFALGDNSFTSSVAPQGFDPGAFTSTIPTVPAYNTHTLTQAFYVDNSYDIDQRLVLVAGLRHDNYRYHRDSLVGGSSVNSDLGATALRLGLTYRLQPDTSLYVQASRGSDPIASLLSLNLGNANFELTTARQIEAGVKQSFADNRGEWTAALYRIEKDKIITRSPSNPSLSLQGGGQSSRGLELSSGFQLDRQWRLDANLALVDARYDNLTDSSGNSLAGKRPSDVPAQVANLWLSYASGPWQAGGGARHVGKRYADSANTQALDAYTVFDACVAWRYDRNTTLRAVLRNLSDKLYASVSYNAGQVSLGEPRRAELVAEFKF